MSRTPDRVDAFVGARIGHRRSALGLSQQALAERLGISPQQIQKYEAGANRVSVSRLHQIATVLATPAAGFFSAALAGRAAYDRRRGRRLADGSAIPDRQPRGPGRRDRLRPHREPRNAPRRSDSRGGARFPLIETAA
jgi:transcriptional regulator with XRE-family HTH domain